MCRAHVSHKWLYHLDACAGSVLTPHDCITKEKNSATESGWVADSAGAAIPSWTHSWTAETCSNAEATRRHYACVHAVVCGMKLADPGITTEPRGLTASQSRPADIFTTAGAALDVCVASSIAAAARGGAAQAAFDRKTFAFQATECSLPVASVDSGRTAAPSRHSDASVRGRHRFQPKRRQMSPKSLHRRWKHEIQIALLRRRAAMARAVLPNPLSASRVALRRHH